MKHFNKKTEKLLLLVFVALLCNVSVKAQLNGTYTVYGAGANYTTLQAAASALSAGVSGPVTFKIRPGTWTDANTVIASIGTVSGASATNTITFEAENGDAATTILVNTNTSTTAGTNNIFYFNGSKYIRVRNLTLNKSNTSAGTVIRYNGDADYNIVENCVMTGGTTTSTSTNMARVYLASGASANNNIVRNNTINFGSVGIYWFGSSTTSLSADNEFSGNKIVDAYNYGIYAYYTSGVKINNNTISRSIAAGTYYGISAIYADNGFEINGNTVTATGGTTSNYGIYLSSSNISNTNRGTINNNTINMSSSSNLYGLYATSSNYYSMNSNTITSTGTTTNALYPLYNYNTSTTYGKDVYVNNNIMTATGTGAKYAYGHYTATNGQFNNNKITLGTASSNGSCLVYAGYSSCNNTEALNNDITLYSANSTAVLYAFYSSNVNCRFNGNKYYRNVYSSSSTHYTYLFYSGNQGSEINDNTFDILSTSTATQYFYAHYSSNTNNLEFSRNTFNQTASSGTIYNYIGYSNTTNAGYNKFNGNKITSTLSSGTLYHYMAYQCYGSNPTNEVKDNVFKMNAGSGSAYNYSAYYMDGGVVTGNDCDVRGAAAYGFMVYGYSSGVQPWTIRNNKVVAIGTSTVYGLYTAYCSNADISNNSVAAISTSGTVYGFYPSYNNGGANVYNNTVYTQSSGTQYTVYTYQSSGSQFVRYRNNVFARSGGTAGYLMYHYQPQYYEWDYNNYWFGGSTFYFGGTGASYNSVTAMRAGIPGQNMNSLTYDPGFMNAGNGDVRPNPANANSWSLNGRGVQISGNDKDINGAARAVTTIQGVPDIGAYEFTPTATPPNCAMAPAAPPANGTQVVTFGQDTVAVLRWGPTVPTGFAVKQYTGTNPPGITTINPTQMFYYVDFQGTGSALNYEQDLYFKDPWLGSIASKSALRLAEKVGANNWAGYAPGTSVANIVRNFISTPSVNDVGALFTGIDVANNASADAIVEPASPFCPGTYLVKLRIKNQGNNIINNVKIDWQQDGGIINTINYNTPININGSSQGNEAVVTLANITFGSAPVNIKAWTYLPNGVNDPVAIDDTLNKDYFAALSGTYTVGGANPHFPTVVAAAKALEDYGTCGNVVFNIRPGTYTGRVTLKDPIRLSSPTNRVTFQAENGNASSVNITYSSTATYDPTIQWNGIDNLTLRNLTINATGPTYGVGIVMSGVCNDDSIIGCNINVTSTTITSANMGIYAYYLNGFTCNNLTVRKSKIIGGYYGAYMYGTSNQYQNNVMFDSCDVSAYYYGLMVYYHNSPKVTNNKIYGQIVGTYSGYMGLYAYYCQQSPVITGNRISGFYYYGLYSYYFSGKNATDKGIIRNNAIVMDATKTSYYPMYFYAPNQLDMINNTVINNGMSSSGNYTIYMYMSPSTSYQNNALINNVFAHTTGGAPLNIYIPSGYSNQMDYNNIHSSDPTKFSVYSGYAANNLDGWRTVSNQDKNSVSYRPSMKSNTNPEPDISDNASWALNGHGVHIAGNTKDINGKTRPETRPAGVPDIGAFEITPDVIPPAATAVPATAGPGDLQVFSFAGNEVGRIKWGNKAPAAPVEMRQYSGEREGTIAAAAAPKGSMYFYTDVKPLSSATTYDFEFNLDYMETWLGDIPNDADLRLAHKVSGYPWMVYSGSLSTLDATTNNIDATDLNRFGKFSALENNSVASAFVRTTGSTVICIGNSVQLDAEPKNGDNYKWYRNGVAIPGAAGPNAKSYTANQAGDYSVEITFGSSSGNKVVESVPATVSTIAAPNAIIGANKQLTYCVGNGLMLNAGNVPGVTYQWQLNGTDIAGATGNTHNVGQAGNYTVVVSNIGCSTVSTVTPVTSGPLNVTLGNDTSYCEVKNVFHKLDAGYPGAKYLWSTGDTTRTVEVRNGGSYWVQVDGGPNCVATDTIKVTIDPLPSAQGISFVQNGNSYQFSPSGAVGATGYLWMFSDGTVSTQQNPTKVINGDLYVRLVMFNACGTDTVQLGWPLSVSNVSEVTTLNVYPNPAKDKVTIGINGAAKLQNIEVLSSLGSVVYRGVVSGSATHSVDVSGLANGHYMLRATTNEGNIISKPFDIVK